MPDLRVCLTPVPAAVLDPCASACPLSCCACFRKDIRKYFKNCVAVGTAICRPVPTTHGGRRRSGRQAGARAPGRRALAGRAWPGASILRGARARGICRSSQDRAPYSCRPAPPRPLREQLGHLTLRCVWRQPSRLLRLLAARSCRNPPHDGGPKRGTCLAKRHIACPRSAAISARHGGTQVPAACAFRARPARDDGSSRAAVSCSHPRLRVPCSRFRFSFLALPLRKSVVESFPASCAVLAPCNA